MKSQSKLKTVGRFLLANAIKIAAIAGLTSAILAGGHNFNRKYNLVLAMQEGGQTKVIESILITHLSRKSDGSICFTVIPINKNGCVKSPVYYLFDVSVQ